MKQDKAGIIISPRKGAIVKNRHKSTAGQVAMNQDVVRLGNL